MGVEDRSFAHQRSAVRYRPRLNHSNHFYLTSHIIINIQFLRF